MNFPIAEFKRAEGRRRKGGLGGQDPLGAVSPRLSGIRGNALFKNHEEDPPSTGQAAISFVFVIGGIIILIGITLAFLNAGFLSSSYGFVASEQALATAQAGVQDATLQLERNMSFSSPGGYGITVGSYSATVTVTQNSPAAGLVTIVSFATVSFHTRKIQAVASVNATTGAVSLVSSQEIND